MDWLDPKLDLIFKLLFVDDETLLRSMVNAVVQPSTQIEGITVLNPGLPPEVTLKKEVFLDLNLKLASGELLDIEMQSRWHTALSERLLYYWAKLFTGQLRRGESYEKLNTARVVAWLSTELSSGPDLHQVFELRERRSRRALNGRLEIHTLELPKLGRGGRRLPVELERWARFLSATSGAEFQQLAGEDRIMERAVKKLEELSADEKNWWQAYAREKALFTYHHTIGASREEGREQGREEGREQGREEGREQGLKEGVELGRAQAAEESRREGFEDGVRRSVRKLVLTKFGERSELMALIESRDASALDEIFTTLLAADELTDFRELLMGAPKRRQS